MRKVIIAAVVVAALAATGAADAATGVVAPGASGSTRLADGSTVTVTNRVVTSTGTLASPFAVAAGSVCSTCQYDVTIRICAPVWCGFWSQTTRVTGVWFNGNIAWRANAAYINPYWNISTWTYTLGILGTWWTGWNPAGLYGQYIGAHTALQVCTSVAGGGCQSHWTEVQLTASGNIRYYTG